MAPTPGPPQRWCTSAASWRSQDTTGDVLPVARQANSRDTHTRAPVTLMARSQGGAPSLPNKERITTVNPASATRRAKSAVVGLGRRREIGQGIPHERSLGGPVI